MDSGHKDTNVSGERFVPELMGGELIEAEHRARYLLAAPYVEGKTVLDAGCGTGWGSELLLHAGAVHVVGVDIASDAIEESRKRVPEGTFVRADLQELPLGDAAFDVVVCFEALEHTEDTSRTLDNLVRVLRSGGLLFASSPNPRVYPAGNPYHFHELTPTELVEAIGSRLPSVALFRQHLHLASTLSMEGTPDGGFTCDVFPVVPLRPGTDPYSVAIASSADLPPIRPTQALSPSAQLLDLDALGTSLAEQRQLLADDQARVLSERHEVLDALEDAHRRLEAAGNDLSDVMEERASAVRQLEAAQSRIDRLSQERDRFAVALVRAEQRLAMLLRDAPRAEAVEEDERQVRVRLEELMAYAAGLERELAALRATVSWRVTSPLRQFKDRLTRGTR